MNNIKFTFLFGSGISIPAGMPKTERITKYILNPYTSVPDKTNSIDDFDIDDDTNLEKPKNLINFIKDYINEYYKDRELENYKANYEDIYYIINQLYEDLILENPNPSLTLFKDKLIEICFENSKVCKLQKILEQAEGYIHGTVTNLLRKPINPNNLEYLNFILDSSNDFGNIDIFTLNHDLVLESYFESNYLKYINGFESFNENDIKYWDPELFNSLKDKFKLYKLHGSINWSREKNVKLRYFINEDKNNNKPEILIGTMNKIIEYSGDIYLDLSNLFYQSLRKSKILIIIGYGFSDYGINRQIISWFINKQKNKKLILIDKYINNLEKKLQEWPIWSNWKKLENECILKCIEMDVKNINWTDIRKELEE